MNTARSAAWVVPGVEQGELCTVEQSNHRLLAEARVVLVGVASFMALLEAPSSTRALVLALLVIYGGIAAHEFWRARAGAPPVAFALSHWTDLGCYLAVAALTGGVSSPYAVFLLFPVFAACLKSGPRHGMLTGLLSAALLAGMAGLSGSLPAPAIVSDALPGQLCLGLVVAVVMYRWAHTEITIVRRLAFCNDVGQLFTPQHDLRRAVSAFCDMLRAHQRADTCVVLLKDTRSAGWLLFEVDGGAKRVGGVPVEEALVQPLLVIPADRCVLYRDRPLAGGAPCRAYDAATLQPVEEFDARPVGELAQLLEARSLVSLPLRSRNQVIGRLHLTTEGWSYGRNDLQFLSQVAAQVGLLIESMQLVERLTKEVANEERKKISRDLHDGTIQPYIGLKLALEALHRKVAADPVLTREVDDLIKMASDGISQLRHYVGNLKHAAQRARRDSLVPAIRHQADKFSEYYGIATEVVTDGDVAVRGLLFEEVMHIVREGLSNIRRHTRSTTARIDVHAEGGRLVLRFANDAAADAAPFFPRSLSERALELGGSVHVDPARGGSTVVSVELPL